MAEQEIENDSATATATGAPPAEKAEKATRKPRKAKAEKPADDAAEEAPLTAEVPANGNGSGARAASPALADDQEAAAPAASDTAAGPAERDAAPPVVRNGKRPDQQAAETLDI